LERQEKSDTVDVSINKIIINTAVIIVSIFTTFGLIMNQVFGEPQRFYELIGWAMTLSVPFIIPAMISVFIIGYKQQIPFKLLRILKHFSVGSYIIAWVWLILRLNSWSSEWFWAEIRAYMYLVILVMVFPLLLIIFVLSIYYVFKRIKTALRI
jgi:hypothetical protein